MINQPNECSPSYYADAIASYRFKQSISFVKSTSLTQKIYPDRFVKLYNTHLDIYHEKDKQKREKPDLHVHLSEITKIILTTNDELKFELQNGTKFSITISPHKLNYVLHPMEILVEFALAYRDIYLSMWTFHYSDILSIEGGYCLDKVPWTLIQENLSNSDDNSENASFDDSSRTKSPFRGINLLENNSNNSSVEKLETNKHHPELSLEIKTTRNLNEIERQVFCYVMSMHPEASNSSPCGNCYTQYLYLLQKEKNFKIIEPFNRDICWQLENVFPIQNHRTLDFSQFQLNKMSSLQTEFLLKSLSINRYFTKIKIVDRILTSNALVNLQEALVKNRMIVDLEISSCEIKSDLLKQLISIFSKTSITRLKLKSLKLDSIAAQAFSVCLPICHLQELDLSECIISQKNCLTILQSLNPCLEILNLKGVKTLDISALKPFFDKPEAINLKNLNLSETDVQISQLPVICKNSGLVNLEIIDLSSCVFRKNTGIFMRSKSQIETNSNSTISQIFQGPKLSTLKLEKCTISASSLIEIIHGISNSYQAGDMNKNISLAGINITEVQRQSMLVSVFANMKNVVELNLSQVNIENAPVNDAQFSEMLCGLSGNRDLVKLDLSDNLTQQSIKKPVGIELSRILAQNINLESLNLKNMKLRQFVGFVIDFLNYPIKLRELNLVCTSLNDMAFRQICIYLKTNCNLESIHLDKNGAISEYYKMLSESLMKNTTLKHVQNPINDSRKMKDGKELDVFIAAWAKIEVCLAENRRCLKGHSKLLFVKEMNRSEQLLSEVRMMTNYLRRFNIVDKSLLDDYNNQSQRGVILDRLFDKNFSFGKKLSSPNLASSTSIQSATIPGTTLPYESATRQIIQQITNKFNEKLENLVNLDETGKQFAPIESKLRNSLESSINPLFANLDKEISAVVENCYATAAGELHESYLELLEADMIDQLNFVHNRDSNLKPALPKRNNSKSEIPPKTEKISSVGPIDSGNLRGATQSGSSLDKESDSPNSFKRGGDDRSSMKHFIKRKTEIAPKRRLPKKYTYEEVELQGKDFSNKIEKQFSNSIEAMDEFDFDMKPKPAPRTGRTADTDRYITYRRVEILYNIILDSEIKLIF